jgi:hypothetical protein
VSLGPNFLPDESRENDANESFSTRPDVTQWLERRLQEQKVVGSMRAIFFVFLTA